MMTIKVSGLPYLVSMPSRNNWQIRDGRRRISTGTSDRAAADQALRDYIIKSATPSNGAKPSGDALKTVGDLVNHWGAEHSRENPKTWKKKWQYVLRVIKRHAETLPITSIDRAWSRAYAEARYDEGVLESSVIQELGTIRAAFREAKRDRLISLPEPSLIIPRQPESRDVYLEKDEAVRLIDACRAPHLRLFVEIALATGGRPGAVTGLAWNRVHLDC